MNQWVVDHLTPVTRDYFDRYVAGHDVLPGYLPGHPVHARVANLSAVTVHLPWPRLFETDLNTDSSRIDHLEVHRQDRLAGILHESAHAA
jgi:hypothetical protein